MLRLISLQLECGDLLYLGTDLCSLGFLRDSHLKVGIANWVFYLQAIVLRLIYQSIDKLLKFVERQTEFD